MYSLTLDLGSFDGGFELLDPFERGAVLRELVEVLALVDELYLRRVATPELYRSGVRYLDTQDNWRDVPRALAAGGGDCKDLVAWRVAELRIAGVKCRPVIQMNWDDDDPNGEILYHVLVGDPDGRVVEDPSRLLGM